MDRQRTLVSEFYDGRHVFITGATGFVGKAAVEKLLYSCRNVAGIYVLMRPKRGKDMRARFAEFTQDPVFKRVLCECPEQLNKIHAVNGDVATTDLGLNNEDRHELIEHVSVILHVAATVKFDEPLKKAVDINMLGTKRIIELARQMKNLVALVHVSTAFSNSDVVGTDERIYPSTMDPDTLINIINNVHPDILSQIEAKLIGKHPNTYTYSKQLAEIIISEQASDLPCAIMRPSIVTAAMKDPVEGWVDSVAAITGVYIEMGRGTIRTVLGDSSIDVNMIPLDITVNAILVAAARIFWTRENTLKIYNVTSPGINWGVLMEKMLTISRQYPSKYTQYYPNCKCSTSRFMHSIYSFFLQYIPAFILDMILRFNSQRAIMVRCYNRNKKTLLNGSFFSLTDFRFKNNNLKELHESLHDKDKENFRLDISSIDWDEYLKTFLIGTRKYILKDDMSSLPSSLNKLNRLRILQLILKGFLLITFIVTLLKVSKPFF